MNAELHAAVVAVKRNLGSITTNLLTLAWLYAAVFVVQVIALPLLSFYGFAKLAGLLFKVDLSRVLDLRPRDERQAADRARVAPAEE